MSAVIVTEKAPTNDTTGTAAAINEQHLLARRDAQSAIAHAIECGRLLIETKAKLAHGQFGDWIKEHCAFSVAMANNYMKAAKNPNALGNSLRSLYLSGSVTKKNADAAASSITAELNKLAAMIPSEPKGKGPTASHRWHETSPLMRTLALHVWQERKKHPNNLMFNVLLLADLLGVDIKDRA